MSETTHRGLRLSLASLLLVALIAQLAIGMSESDLTVANFFSYFTVISNSSAVVLLVLLAARPDRDKSVGFATFRGAVTVYMSVTALVYALFLAPMGAEVGGSEPWIDWSIHVIGPIGIVVDWVFDPPPVRLPLSALAVWLIFPTGYLGYSLLRGRLLDWYPYPFLDPDQGGYTSVALWSSVVLIVIVSFGAAFYWWCNRHQVVEAQ